MEIVVETSRLILRKLVPADAEVFFEMDSNAEVHKYLGNNPMQSISQAHHAIQLIQQPVL